MRSIFLVVLLVLSLCTQAQITLVGKVADKETGEGLPFASVSLQGKSVSTITNLEGEFEFHIPSEFQNDILVVSMLGYKNMEAPVWSLISSGDLLIQMEKSTTVLKELVITDSLLGSEILQIALGRIKQNYPMKPFIMDGFYRDVKKVAGTNISLLEAAVKIHDENYAKPRNQYKLRENVQLVEVRRSLGYESKFTAYFDQNNLLEDLLLHNDVRYYWIPTDEVFLNGLKREPNSYYNNKEVYVISHSGDYNLKIFIDTENYGILFLNFESNLRFDDTRKKGMISRFVYVKREIAFRAFEGRLYLNYMSMTSRINWYDIVTDDLKFETELTQQLLINDLETNTKKRIPSSKSMKNYGLQYQHQPYNKEFWDTYNVIKQTPLDKEIIEDLEKVAPLEEQFKDN